MSAAPWTLRAAWALLAAALSASACDSSAPRPSPAPSPIPVVPVNQPPVIRSVDAAAPRLEAGATINLSAIVEDAETPADRLQYQWTAEAGTIAGEGPRVTWQAPTGVATPIEYAITLTVVESYTVNGLPQTNRAVLASAPLRVHDSRVELTKLAEEFLDDFSDDDVSASQCVRNFSDSCPGKRDELADIERVRREYKMLSSEYFVQAVTIHSPWQRAEVRASCEFRSQNRETRQTGTARGTCALEAVYESNRWWLCKSSLSGSSLLRTLGWAVR